MYRFMPFFRISGCFVCLFAAALQPKVSSALQLIQPPKIAPTSIEPMKALLIQHWQPGSENRTLVESQFAQIKDKSPEWILAYVANRLNDGRRKEALVALESATLKDIRFLDGWLLKSHLHLVADQFEAGLVSLRSAKLAFDDKNATAEQRTAFYQRAGELIGYLQGPVATRVDQKLLNSVVEQIIKGAAEPELGAFRTASEQMQQQFAQRLQTTQARLNAELQKQAETDASRQEALTAQNQSLMQNEQALRDRQNQLRDELGQSESQLTSELSPLQNNLSNLESQIASLQLNLQYLYSDLAHAQNQPVVCPITVRAIMDQINRAELNLYNLQVNHQSFVAQFQSVQSQLQSTRSQYNAQLGEIQRELKRVNSTLSRNRNQLTRIAAGPRVASGKREAEANRVTAMGSYLKVSHELIRQQLLEGLN